MLERPSWQGLLGGLLFVLRDLGGPEGSSGPVCSSVPLEGHCPMGRSSYFKFLIKKHKNLLFPHLGCSEGFPAPLLWGTQHPTELPDRDNDTPALSPPPPWSWPHPSPIFILLPDKSQPCLHSHPIPGFIPSPLPSHPISSLTPSQLLL